MKIRRDFVTNSSSSSFIIAKKHLDEKQITAIWRHSTLAEKMGLSCFDDFWDIEENEKFISGHTFMDNFDMFEFFEKIDVNMHNVKWDDFYFDIDNYTDEDDLEEDLEENLEKNKKNDWRNML